MRTNSGEGGEVGEASLAFSETAPMDNSVVASQNTALTYLVTHPHHFWTDVSSAAYRKTCTHVYCTSFHNSREAESA